VDTPVFAWDASILGGLRASFKRNELLFSGPQVQDPQPGCSSILSVYLRWSGYRSLRAH